MCGLWVNKSFWFSYDCLDTYAIKLLFKCASYRENETRYCFFMVINSTTVSFWTWSTSNDTNQSIQMINQSTFMWLSQINTELYKRSIIIILMKEKVPSYDLFSSLWFNDFSILRLKSCCCYCCFLLFVFILFYWWSNFKNGTVSELKRREIDLVHWKVIFLVI